MADRRAGPLDVLRIAAWLTPDRAGVYGGLISLTLVIATLAFLGKIIAPALTDPQHRPLASDFDTFWAGARLASNGHPEASYNPAAIRQAESLGAQPDAGQFFAYLYPPPFLLVCLPLAALPYPVALPVFLFGGLAVLFVGLRRILPSPFPWWPILAFPAGLLNLVIGQNGCFSAACFAGALLLLEDRPLLGGLCLGCLVTKPQLAIGVPVTLLAARRWTALAACAGAAAGLILASWLILGGASWAAFLAAGPLARNMMMSPQIWPKMGSIVSAIRLLHGSLVLAYATQTVSCVIALAITARVCLRRPGAGPEIATLAAAATLLTPYVWDYDLAILAVPLAWLVSQASDTSWRPWEKLVAACVYIGPVLVRMLNVSAGLPLAPLMCAALLAVTASRSLSTRPPVALCRS